jgi:RNA recognition motif-containing protein
LNIYVGNLSFDTTEDELHAAFAAYGAVTSARIATDRDTGRARGFGFVEMASESEAKAAMTALNGSQLQGRTLTVNEARPREEGGQNRNQDRGYAGGRSRY